MSTDTEATTTPGDDFSFGQESIEDTMAPSAPETTASPDAAGSAPEPAPATEPESLASDIESGEPLNDADLAIAVSDLGLTDHQVRLLGKDRIADLYLEHVQRDMAARAARQASTPPPAPEPPPDVTGLPEAVAKAVLDVHRERQELAALKAEIVAGQQNSSQAIMFQQFEGAVASISKEMYGEGGLKDVTPQQAKARVDLARTAEAIRVGRQSIGEAPLPMAQLTKMAHLALHGEKLSQQVVKAAADKSKAHAAGSVARPAPTHPPASTRRELALKNAREFAAAKGFRYDETADDEVGDF